MKYLIPFIILFLFNVSTNAQKEIKNLGELNYEELKEQIKINLSEGTYKEAIPICKVGMQKADKELGKQDSIYLDFAVSLGMLYLNLGQFEQAETSMLEVKAISLDYYGEKSIKYAVALNELGYLYSESGKLKESKELYQQAAKIYKDKKVTSGEAYASLLNNYANMEQENGNYKDAERLFLKLEKVDRAAYGEQHQNYAITLNNMAMLYRRMEQFEKTEALYDKALEIWRNTLGEEHPNYAVTLNNLAFLKEKLGKLEEAETLSAKVVELDAKTLGKEHPVYGRSLNNLAALYAKMKRYDESERLYLEAKGIWEKTIGRTHFLYGDLMSNMALMYAKTNRIEDAKIIYKEVIENDKSNYGEEHVKYAYSLMNLAEMNVRGKTYQKDSLAYQEAVVLLKQSLKIIEKKVGTSHADYAISLIRYGLICDKMGRKKQAEKLLLQAKEIYETTYSTSHFKHVKALNHLTNFYYKNNELEKAYQYAIASFAATSKNFEDYFPNVFVGENTSADLNYNPSNCCQDIAPLDFLQLSKLEFNDPSLLGDLFQSAIRVTDLEYRQLLKERKIKTANVKLQAHYNITKAAMDVNEWVRNNYAEKGDKLRALKDNSYLADLGIKAALDVGGENEIAEAFGFAEQNKSVLLGDALKGNRARILGDLPDSLVLKELKLGTQKEKFQKERYLAKTEKARLAIIAKENTLMKEYGAFIQSIKDKYPKYHALKYEKITIKATDIQDAMEDDETLLLEYFVGKDATYLFVISKSTIDLIPISLSRDSLNKQIKLLRKALSDYKFILEQKDMAYNQYTRMAHWFYQNLLQPALNEKSIKNLIIVTDGELAHLPFEAFLTKAIEQKKEPYNALPYLINEYRISYDYSATLWKENYKKKSTNESLTSFKKGEMLACAAAYHSKEDWKGLEQQDSSWMAWRLPHNYKLRKSLNPLPGAQTEVNELSKLFKGTFLQNDSTNERFFKEHAQEYSIIHLAMHGILHPRIPMLSSLAFTENKDSLENNFLQAYEIARLQLNADLVVLSACETGYGVFQQGEGVLSLARSFMYAGAPSLVVSLWQVNDQSTALIMSDFYNNLKAGLPKNDALRQAKLAYLKKTSGITGHPVFWSAFIQLGNSNPITIKGTASSWKWWLVIIGILAVGIGLWLKQKMVA